MCKMEKASWYNQVSILLRFQLSRCHLQIKKIQIVTRNRQFQIWIIKMIPTVILKVPLTIAPTQQLITPIKIKFPTPTIQSIHMETIVATVVQPILSQVTMTSQVTWEIWTCTICTTEGSKVEPSIPSTVLLFNSSLSSPLIALWSYTITSVMIRCCLIRLIIKLLILKLQILTWVTSYLLSVHKRPGPIWLHGKTTFHHLRPIWALPLINSLSKTLYLTMRIYSLQPHGRVKLWLKLPSSCKKTQMLDFWRVMHYSLAPASI